MSITKKLEDVLTSPQEFLVEEQAKGRENVALGKMVRGGYAKKNGGTLLWI